MPTLNFLPIVLGLALAGQSTPGIQSLESDKPVEREIAGGESRMRT